MDPQGRIASALAVSGDRIVAVGSRAEIEARTDDRTRVVDLAGRSLIPGLMDAHMHSSLHRLGTHKFLCRTPEITTVATLQEALRRKTAEVPEGEWISGTLYDHFRLEERRHITRTELDAAAPRHPVILERYGHECVVNSRALRLAGIDEVTPTPVGGVIGKGANGQLTGLVVDTAMSLLRRALPEVTEASMTERLRALARECHQVGITTIHDAGVGFYSPVQVSAYHRLHRQEGIRLRVYMVMANFYHPGREPSVGSFIRASGIRTGFGDDWLKVGPIKLMADGGASGGSAAMFEPFEGEPDNIGCTYWEQEELDGLVAEIHEAGCQVAIHAVGDRAVAMALGSIGRALEKAPRENHRHRIEHGAVMPPSLVAQAARLGVVVTPNPAFLVTLGESYKRYLGEARLRHTFPLRSFRDAGVVAAGASDAPITDLNPFLGMYGATVRRTEQGVQLPDAERIDPLDALRLYTFNGAYAAFEEQEKGSLEVGKLADLAVVSTDLTQIVPEALREVRVDMTVVGGEAVYERG
ncbi:MAG: amidohydrolase [Candidatus Methylomirabilia bacterium]